MVDQLRSWGHEIIATGQTKNLLEIQKCNISRFIEKTKPKLTYAS